MTKKTDFERQPIKQHEDLLESGFYKHRVIKDKRLSKSQRKRLTAQEVLKELENDN